MVNEDKLSSVLSEFARTLITDFPIQRILDHLVERIVEVLPVTSAGVTLISAGSAPHYVAASNGAALLFEQLQTELGEGPCLWAYESGEAICAPDLAIEDPRFPHFAPAAVAAGLQSVFTFPLRHGEDRLGALDLYRDRSGDLDADDMAAAQTLADVAAAYLLNARARDEARATSDRFHHSAMHDTLTGLPNRLLLQERLEHASQRAKRSHTGTAILFADLDNFKNVNDTFGHLVGDELLLAVARRMSGLIRSSDTLARFSGDEFVFLVEGLKCPGDVEVLAHRINGAFTEPFQLAGAQVVVTASIGTAFAGPGEEITRDLLFRADMAMYQGKRRGGERKIIDVHEALSTMDDHSLEADLRLSLANHELDVAYQPIVSMQTHRIEGVEALLRWTHAGRGPVPPTAMVSVAERTGLISEIGTWILEQSCRDHRAWQIAHPGTRLDLSVNVSVRQILNPTYYESVADVLERTRMDPTLLILEITESTLIEHGDRVVAVLNALTELGIRLALDDFGTGYSSLSYLARLPVHVIKIDGSLVGDIGNDAGRAIVGAVTNLSHTLGMVVVAEGVENSSQRNDVHDIGCDFAQGYFLGRPMPAADIAILLEQPPIAQPGPVHPVLAQPMTAVAS